MTGEGHEIKSRAYSTNITCSTIAGRNGVDSRSIDIPNGGDSYIVGNTIEKGPNSSNGQVIGYAMEVRSSGYNPTQRVHIANNVFISDCTAHAVTHIAMEESPANGWLVAENEFVAGKYMVTIGGSSVDTTISESNVYYDSRNSANLGPYSDLPAPPCTN